MNFVIILPNVLKCPLKKLSITIKESSNFNKGKVNYELQLKIDINGIKINFVIIWPTGLRSYCLINV